MVLQITHNLKPDILYELLVYSEWKHIEQIKSDRNLVIPKTTILNKILNFISWSSSIPQTIYELVGCLLPWQFSVAENGKIIAILQDTALEIRSSKDEYSSVIGKATGGTLQNLLLFIKTKC